MTILTDLNGIREQLGILAELKTRLRTLLNSKGQVAQENAGYDALIPLVGNLKPANYVSPATWVERLIANDDSVVPSGTYATSTYYNVDYGVKVGYCSNGDILISMKGGTSTAYENLYFTLATAPDGVSIVASSSSWGSSNPAGQLHVCVISGLTAKCNLAISMSSINSSYDYVACNITLTEV